MLRELISNNMPNTLGETGDIFPDRVSLVGYWVLKGTFDFCDERDNSLRAMLLKYWICLPDKDYTGLIFFLHQSPRLEQNLLK